MVFTYRKRYVDSLNIANNNSLLNKVDLLSSMSKSSIFFR